MMCRLFESVTRTVEDELCAFVRGDLGYAHIEIVWYTSRKTPACDQIVAVDFIERCETGLPFRSS